MTSDGRQEGDAGPAAYAAALHRSAEPDYVPRRLQLTYPDGREEVVDENLLGRDLLPLMILGEPGIGKSELTRALAATSGALRVEASRFWRMHDPAGELPLAEDQILVIDGLDEITTNESGQAIDQVLRQLSKLGRPPFALSCRAADWLASSGGYRIAQDYGRAPSIAHIAALSRTEAHTLLSALSPQFDAGAILAELIASGLDDLYGNPLSLRLLATVLRDGGGLPRSKAELFQRACDLLILEQNPMHGDSSAGDASPHLLQDAAGAISAVILLSGRQGVSRLPSHRTPPGYLPSPVVENLAGARPGRTVLGTRLFRGVREGLFEPTHRVIAEYLAARWLGRRLESGLSTERVMRALTVDGGVPTALRGLHAWLAHFNSRLASRCIKADPYGVLRYGDTERLSSDHARLLLRSLEHLVEEDPYFRADDWARHAAAGLVRPELKEDLERLITRAGRHSHLSALIIEALQGSSVAADMVQTLTRVMHARDAGFAERRSAMEVLLREGSKVDPRWLMDRLTSEGEDGARLSLSLIEFSDWGFSDEEIATAYLRSLSFERRANAPTSPGREEEAATRSTFISSVPAPRAAGVLDALAEQRPVAASLFAPERWDELCRGAAALLQKVALCPEHVAPERFWNWLATFGYTFAQSEQGLKRIADFISSDPEWRLALQWAALTDQKLRGTATAHIEPRPPLQLGLHLTDQDRLAHLARVRAKPRLTAAEIAAWQAMVAHRLGPGSALVELKHAVETSAAAHRVLTKIWALELRTWADFERSDYGSHPQAQRGEGSAPARRRGAMVSSRADRPASPRAAPKSQSSLSATIEAGPARSALEFSRATIVQDTMDFEDLILRGLEEHYLQAGGLGDFPPGVLEVCLAVCSLRDQATRSIWSELEEKLEERLLVSTAHVEAFLTALVEPQLEAGRAPAPLLTRLEANPRYAAYSAALALGWLRRYPSLPPEPLRALLRLALRSSAHDEALIALAGAQAASGESRHLLNAAAFLVRRDSAGTDAKDTLDTSDLSAIRDLTPVRGLDTLQPSQLDRLIRLQEEGLGSEAGIDPREGRAFLHDCIESLASRDDGAASDRLDDLVRGASKESLDRLLHARARQAARRRNGLYTPLAPDAAISLLQGGPPTTIEDLLAVVVEALAAVQAQLLQGELDGWRMFWEGERPLSEERCRDRLLLLLDPRLPAPLQVQAESLMPDRKRADALVLCAGLGLPIEVKGQWHRDLWSAGSSQLDALYSGSFRAQGYGLYLVFWFGLNAGRPFPLHPHRLSPPQNASELRRLLLDRLPASRRSCVEVFVIDVEGARPLADRTVRGDA